MNQILKIAVLKIDIFIKIKTQTFKNAILEHFNIRHKEFEQSILLFKQITENENIAHCLTHNLNAQTFQIFVERINLQEISTHLLKHNKLVDV